MSAVVACRECGARLHVRNGRANRAHERNGAIVRRKWCRACGHEETTAEIAIGDLGRYLLALQRMDAQN